MDRDDPGSPRLPVRCHPTGSRLTLGPGAASPRSHRQTHKKKPHFSSCCQYWDAPAQNQTWGVFLGSGGCPSPGLQCPQEKEKSPAPPFPQEFFPGLFEAKHSPPAAFTWEAMRHNLWKPASWAGATSVRTYRKQLHCRGASQKELLC